MLQPTNADKNFFVLQSGSHNMDTFPESFNAQNSSREYAKKLEQLRSDQRNGFVTEHTEHTTKQAQLLKHVRASIVAEYNDFLESKDTLTDNIIVNVPKELDTTMCTSLIYELSQRFNIKCTFEWLQSEYSIRYGKHCDPAFDNFDWTRTARLKTIKISLNNDK